MPPKENQVLCLDCPLQNEQCRTIQLTFGISDSEFNLMNPGIDCTAVIPTATMICLEQGSETSFNCVPHVVQATEPCDDLRNLGVTVGNDGVAQPLSLLDLYRYNPGLRCDILPLSTLSAASLQVCAFILLPAFTVLIG